MERIFQGETLVLSAAALHIRKLSVLIRPVCAASVLSLRVESVGEWFRHSDYVHPCKTRNIKDLVYAKA